MLTTISSSIAALIAVAVLGMGSTYLVDPQRVTPSFGLKPPAADPDTRAWLRLKGIRDVGAGLVVLTMLLLADKHTVGLVLLAFAIVPFGDMVIVLTSGGRKSAAYAIHGLTFAVMLVAGFLLVQAHSL